MEEADFDFEPRTFFTAPWDPVLVRRGDALGLRALADRFAQAVAPDLSNRVNDGRWVTILAWCLARSHQAFHASGGRGVSTHREQGRRYAWLRPLELMWIARTIALAHDDWRGRPLSGQRRVRAWYEDDDQKTPRFGMSGDQFRSYRQTGPYGGYRLAFRKWPDMTEQSDGWTPTAATNKLAHWLDAKLGAARPEWPLHGGLSDEGSPLKRSAKLSVGGEDRWWLDKWSSFDQRGRNADENTLPRGREDFKPLPEIDLIRPIIFKTKDGAGVRRTQVARQIAESSASDHMQVCTHLARVFRDSHVIAHLPRFSRLADAGMEAMDLMARTLAQNGTLSLADVAALPEAKPICKELFDAARAWIGAANLQVRHIETAERFANAIDTPQPSRCLSRLLCHHEVFGGGLRWFVLRNGRIEPRTPPGAGTSRYRFRLWSLCRLATQCRVIRSMPLALRRDPEEDEPSEAAVE